MTEDYAVKYFSGAARRQSELTAAFDRVAPKGNWKNPIDCEVDAKADIADGYHLTTRA
jgi:hypothetical protein